MYGQRQNDASGRGFTLIELLVVIVIVVLVSAVALPTVLPALSNRSVNEAARFVQGALAGARDSAIRANAPRGIRLLPDFTLSDLSNSEGGGTTDGSISTGGNKVGQVLVANRIVPIEPAPDLIDSTTSGSATFVDHTNTTQTNFAWTNINGVPPTFPFPSNLIPASKRGQYPFPLYNISGTVVLSSTTSQPIFGVLMVAQAVYVGNNKNGLLLPNPPTNWFWNVRIGDKFRINDSGRYYTVVGPMTIPNPEFFVNDGPPGNSTLQLQYGSVAAGTNVPVSDGFGHPEFLFLANGYDDNGDGYADNLFDGVDNDYDGQIDNMMAASTLTVGEGPLGGASEIETWLGAEGGAEAAAQNNNFPATFKWTITRRPIPSPGAREIYLPGGAVVDLTTCGPGLSNERSRLPVDPYSGYVDVLVNQAGQVVPTTQYSTPSSANMASSFYHFWIADRADIYDPNLTSTFDSSKNLIPPALPIPTFPGGGSPPAGIPSLKKDRMLVTLFARTGQILSGSVENFDFPNAYKTSYDISRPFDEIQTGIREAK